MDLRDAFALAECPAERAARVTVPGEHHGAEGRVVKRGRTSYSLRTGRRVLRVPFAWVEPV